MSQIRRSGQRTKADLEEEIEELTRGAIAHEYLDPWAGRRKRVELGMKLARNKWDQCAYTYDELVQIRDWLRSHLWRERVMEVADASDLGRRSVEV